MIKSERAKELVVFKIVVRFHEVNTKSGVKGLKLLLSDKETASRFRLHRFNMKGVDLKSSDGDHGLNKYMIRLQKEYHLEEDDNFQCRTYRPGEYHQCLQKEYSRQFSDILNCTPHWLTERAELWCDDHLNVPFQTISKYRNLLDQVAYGKANIGNCLRPCRKTSFEVEDIGFYSVQNVSGLVIAFDEEVEVETSELQISPKTFLTRVGGVIGVGKEFLWIVLCCLSVLKVLGKIIWNSKKF